MELGKKARNYQDKHFKNKGDFIRQIGNRWKKRSKVGDFLKIIN